MPSSFYTSNFVSLKHSSYILSLVNFFLYKWSSYILSLVNSEPALSLWILPGSPCSKDGPPSPHYCGTDFKPLAFVTYLCIHCSPVFLFLQMEGRVGGKLTMALSLTSIRLVCGGCMASLCKTDSHASTQDKVLRLLCPACSMTTQLNVMTIFSIHYWYHKHYFRFSFWRIRITYSQICHRCAIKGTSAI